jgi:hypothetical protein
MYHYNDGNRVHQVLNHGNFSRMMAREAGSHYQEKDDIRRHHANSDHQKKQKEVCINEVIQDDEKHETDTGNYH